MVACFIEAPLTAPLQHFFGVLANSMGLEFTIARPKTHHSAALLEAAFGATWQSTHRGARTHDHKVKSLALYRLS